MELSAEQQNFLKNNYFNPSGKASFSGLDKFYKFVRSQRQDISRKQLRQWLQNQPSYSLFKKVKHKVKRPQVISPFKFYQMDMDTVHMEKFADDNDGYKYIAVFIDILSHFLYTFPLKTLTSSEMKSVMEKLFEQVKPYLVRSDRGGEYKGVIKDFLAKSSVKHVTTSEHSKANYAERLIRTLRLKLARYMQHNRTHRWIDALPEITQSYNNTYHRTIKMTPSEALKADDDLLWNIQYQPSNLSQTLESHTPKSFKFKVGDIVRIVKLSGKFEKESEPKWTEEFFSIASRTRNQGFPKYMLKDFNNEPIIDSFMEHELQKVEVTDDTSYDIEKIIRRRKRKGKSQVLVRWKGWGPKFDSWIDASEIDNFK